MKSHTTTDTVPNKEMILADIDKRIDDLRAEERDMCCVYTKLAVFLHKNTILPINDDFLAYLDHFIREEQIKRSAGACNTEVIAGLQKMTTEFKQEIELLKATLQVQVDSGNKIDVPQPDQIFDLVHTLYGLPINGNKSVSK
jgi:hypothetical protein